MVAVSAPVGTSRTPARLGDFVVASEIVLPDLPPAAGAAEPDVRIQFGRTPQELEAARWVGAGLAARPGAALHWLDGVARFLVTEGREILVERTGETSDAALRALLWSTPLAALALQRGLLALHASAVATPQGAVLIAGAAAQGKSTLAAELWRRGGFFLADDVALVRVGPDGVAVLPGVPALRLWPDALRTLALEHETTELRPGVTKRLLVCRERVAAAPVPLRALVFLERLDGTAAGSPARLGGAEALAAILDSVYRPALTRGLGVERQVLAQATTLAKSMRCVRLRAGSGGPERAGLATAVEQEVRS
ncbi:MAG: hypothetical protein RLZZ15_2137 [Verrucomicrobiota bacterium]